MFFLILFKITLLEKIRCYSFFEKQIKNCFERVNKYNLRSSFFHKLIELKRIKLSGEDYLCARDNLMYSIHHLYWPYIF